MGDKNPHKLMKKKKIVEKVVLQTQVETEVAPNKKHKK